MAEKLHILDIELIINTINNWDLPSQISWKSLCARLESILNRTISRQALARHSDIMDAFNQAKNRSKNHYSSIKIPLTLKSAAEKINRLEKENIKLTQDNTKLLILISQLQMAAYGKNVKLENLPKTNEKIDCQF